MKEEGREKNVTEGGQRLKRWLPAAAAAGILAVVYVGLSVFFMSHFYFRTTLNGMKVSGCSANSVVSKTEGIIDDYTLTITDREGGKYTIAGKDFSLSQRWNDGIGELVKRQSGFAWIAKLFAPDELELTGVVEYNESELKSVLKAQGFMDSGSQKQAVSASVSDYTEDGYTVVPAVQGTVVNEDALVLAVEKTILSLNDELDLEEAECYEKPEVDDDDEKLLASIDKLNNYAQSVINYSMGEKKERLDIETFKDWLKVSDEFKVTIDKEKVKEYVSSLAKKYNTCYSAKKLKTSWGEEVTIEDSHYGWKVDEDAESAQILKDLKAGKPVTRDLNYSMTANSHGENDYGGSYVEVNLTAQHLYLYKDGKAVLDTDVVTGNLSRGDGTPPGAYTLTYKQKDAELRGANYSSHVDYWMPFYGNYGMHDATWRSNFGGSIYKTSGSHGCVNLPPSVAKQIFDVVDKGWPVLVYSLGGTEPVPEPEPDTEDTTEKSKSQAAEVDKTIEKAVGKEVKLENGEAIAMARDEYDALASEAKKYVKNYDLLKNAEKTLEKLEKEQEETQKEEASGKKKKKKSDSDDETAEKKSKKKKTDSAAGEGDEETGKSSDEKASDSKKKKKSDDSEEAEETSAKKTKKDSGKTSEEDEDDEE